MKASYPGSGPGKWALYHRQTLIDTSPGRIRVGRKVYPDPRNYGEITVTRVIQKVQPGRSD